MTSDEQFEKWWKAELEDGIDGLSTEDIASGAFYARDDEIAALRLEIAQLKRPPMTRELPTVEGWYWYSNDNYPRHSIVTIRVIVNALGVRAFVDDGILPIEDMDPGYWSARPIEMDPMPEGGER